MSKPAIRLLLLGAALCAGLTGYWLAQQLDRGGPRLASGTWLPQPQPLPEFTLTDSAGAALTHAALTGAPTLVFFGFTRCPGVCPLTLTTLAAARQRAALPQLRVLFVSVDPERDSPAAIGAYVHGFDPEFRGASAAPQALAALARSFGVAVSRVALPGGDYTLDHSAVVFLLDARGRIAAVFTPPFEAAALAADLRRAAPYVGGAAARASS
jgi:protein SCO1/2